MTGILDEVFDPVIERNKKYITHAKAEGNSTYIFMHTELLKQAEQLKQQLAERIKKSAIYGTDENWNVVILEELLGVQKK